MSLHPLRTLASLLSRQVPRTGWYFDNIDKAMREVLRAYSRRTEILGVAEVSASSAQDAALAEDALILEFENSLVLGVMFGGRPVHASWPSAVSGDEVTVVNILDPDAPSVTIPLDTEGEVATGTEIENPDNYFRFTLLATNSDGDGGTAADARLVVVIDADPTAISEGLNYADVDPIPLHTVLGVLKDSEQHGAADFAVIGHGVWYSEDDSGHDPGLFWVPNQNNYLGV